MCCWVTRTTSKSKCRACIQLFRRMTGFLSRHRKELCRSLPNCRTVKKKVMYFLYLTLLDERVDHPDINLRVNVSMHMTNSDKSPKIRLHSYFHILWPIFPKNCGVVFWWKYISVFKKWFFSFDRSNMKIFTVNITWVVWPHVTNILDLRYFCQHNPLFYLLNLIICHYWSWQRNFFFLITLCFTTF